MNTDTKIKTLIFNKLTQEQYNNADRVPTEFYLTPDTSIDSSEKGAANGVASLDTNGKVPTEQIPVATTSALGGVKPDGTTITATEDGTISAVISGEEVATKADLQSLQTQINSLNTEVTGMLGRMNFNARVDFSLEHGQSYTVPSKGYLWVNYIGGRSNGGTAYINGGTFANGTANDSALSSVRAFVPVSAGDVLSASRYDNQSTVTVVGFFVPQV